MYQSITIYDFTVRLTIKMKLNYHTLLVFKKEFHIHIEQCILIGTFFSSKKKSPKTKTKLIFYKDRQEKAINQLEIIISFAIMKRKSR